MQQSWTNIYNERPSHINLSIHTTLLSKAIYEHFTEPSDIARVAAASSSIRNSSLGANLAALIPLDDDSVINLFTTVFHPTNNFAVQFTSTLAILLDRVDFEAEKEVGGNMSIPFVLSDGEDDDDVEENDQDRHWEDCTDEEYEEGLEAEEYYKNHPTPAARCDYGEDDKNAINCLCQHQLQHTNHRVIEYVSALKATTYFCRSLINLEMWYPCPSCIQVLRGMTALRNLKLSRYVPCASDAAVFDSLSPSLKSVELRFHYSVTDDDLASLLTWESAPRVVASVDLSGTQISDASIQAVVVTKFCKMHTLNLCKTIHVTDAGLDALCSSSLCARHLRHLDLHVNKVTNATLQHHISKLKNLTFLDLRSTKILDGGLAHIADKLENLTYLNVSSTRIDDQSLEPLHQLENLTSLDLSSADFITDTGLREMMLRGREENHSSIHVHDDENCSCLQCLDLCGCRDITNQGLAFVSKLPNLTQINLFETAVDEEGLLSIFGNTNSNDNHNNNNNNPKKLRHLGITGSKVASSTDVIFAKLKKFLPELEQVE